MLIESAFTCVLSTRAVQALALSVTEGGVILVRWGKMAENIPKESVRHTCEKGRVRGHSLLRKAG